MDFPALRAYLAAVADKKNINIPFFQSQSMQIFLNRRGAPYMSVGGFGAVFRYKDSKDKQYAIKVFTRDAPGRADRYGALHNTFKITKFPFMVDFQYVEKGIKVGQKYFPVVVMEWGRGIPINSAISQDLEDDGILQGNRVFGGNLFSIVKVLQEWNMGHGDLQEGNLVVGNDNHISLIDYDGMFVPALEGGKANEIGLADYQHPNRNNDHFGSSIDDFSLISILFQLSIISPKLWDSLHDDKRLILRQNDYIEAEKSPVIREGLKSKNPVTNELAHLLVEACSLDPLKINAIKRISSSSTLMDWLILPEKTSPNQKYSSIIDQVVTLTDEQVSNYESSEIVIESEAEEPEQVVKTRSGEDGNWGFISNLFFDDVEDDAVESGGALGKMKSKLFGLLFEETATDPGSQTAAKQTIRTDPPAVSPPQPANVLPKAPASPAKVPITEEKPEDNDVKTAPIPDWLKRRKKKF